MKVYQIILLISVGMQVCVSSPLPHTSDIVVSDEVIKKSFGNIDNESTDTEHQKRIELLRFGYKKLFHVIQNLFEQSEPVISNMLKDIDQIDSNLSAKYKIRFEKYLNKLETLKKTPDETGYETIMTYIKLSDIIEELEEESDSKMLEFMENHKYRKFNSVVEKAFVAHFKEFSQKFDEFSNSLSALEKQNEQKLLEWYQKFTKETKFEEKLIIYFDIYVEKKNNNKN